MFRHPEYIIEKSLELLLNIVLAACAEILVNLFNAQLSSARESPLFFPWTSRSSKNHWRSRRRKNIVNEWFSRSYKSTRCVKCVGLDTWRTRRFFNIRSLCMRPPPFRRRTPPPNPPYRPRPLISIAVFFWRGTYITWPININLLAINGAQTIRCKI